MHANAHPHLLVDRGYSLCYQLETNMGMNFNTKVKLSMDLSFTPCSEVYLYTLMSDCAV